MGAFGRVQHQRDVIILQPVNDVRAAFVDLGDGLRGHPLLGQPSGRALGGNDDKAHRHQIPRGVGKGFGLVHVLHAQEDAALGRQDRACAHLGLEEGQCKGAVPAHHLTR